MKHQVYVLWTILLVSYISAGQQANNENNCQELNPSQLQSDALLRDAFDQGIKWLFREAAGEYGVSYSDIEVMNVRSICHWQVGNDIYNIFDVVATNNDDATIRGTFTVNCKDDDSAPPKVTNWEYFIEYTNSEEVQLSDDNYGHINNEQDAEVEVDVEINVENGAGGLGVEEANVQANSEANCEELDPSQLQTDALLRDAFDQGIKWLFRQAADKYGISYADIEATNIGRICHWQVGNDIYNIFEVTATNNVDATIQAKFTVDCKDDDSEPPKVIKWNYHIEYSTNPEEENTENIEHTGQIAPNVEVELNIENGESGEGDVNVQVNVEAGPVGFGEEEQNFQANSEENCQELDPSQLDTDYLLRDAFNQGIKWLFRQAADKYGISYADIQATNIHRICHWQVGNDIYNIFDVTATNNVDATMQATFTVDCKDDDSAPPKVVKWNYQIQYQSNDQAQQANEQGQD